jgi:hypothetical protein
MSQRGEYQNTVKTIADDMTRKWIRLKASAGKDKSAEIKRINDKLEALRARDVFKQAVMDDGYYGRGHVYIDTGDGLLTIIGSPVSDMLKPAYSFGGIPIIQKAKPCVDNYLAMRQNVQDYSRSLGLWPRTRLWSRTLSGALRSTPSRASGWRT